MLPRRLNEELFDELADRQGPDLVSILIPTHVRGREVAQDPIRLKNQLSAVDDELASRGWKPRQRADRLDAAESLEDDRDFWEHQSEGLALYIGEDGEIWPVELGYDPEPSWWVLPVFVVRPLLAQLSSLRLAALALSRDFVALYSVSARSARLLDVDLPESFEDVNWFVDRETQRQQHPDRVGTDRSRHGHDPRSKEEEDLERFLREVASALPSLPDDTPLVVLGDDDLVARFSNLADLSTISPENSGFSAPVSEEQIHEMAGPVIETVELERRDQLESRAREKLGLDQATTDIGEALPAAISGRVEMLAVDVDADPIWGRVDESTLEVVVTEDPNPSDVDLLDRLVVLARRTGAEVRGITSSIAEAPFVASFRY